MAQAIHDVYCGIMADHSHPSEKDHEQARSMIAALQKVAAGPEAYVEVRWREGTGPPVRRGSI